MSTSDVCSIQLQREHGDRISSIEARQKLLEESYHNLEVAQVRLEEQIKLLSESVCRLDTSTRELTKINQELLVQQSKVDGGLDGSYKVVIACITIISIVVTALFTLLK